MLKRLISMLVGIGILVSVMALNNTIVFNAAVTVISVVGLYEFYNAMRKIDIKPIEWLRILKYFNTWMLTICKYKF